ncbi:hypothetical protein LTR62_002945 [Meristemomyces frigidus]|uniref:Uncharacterized protein n=1 Tax=Meristemomyces frigidus TaxID=1508187 RepID=A0AAN7YNH7_9PEZI|nr:hypothetical protein LTR62_002945 [Meristemomyces frigidus]
MVFGILTAVAAAPAIVGTTEAIRQGQRENKREEHRGRKNNLTVTLLRRSPYRVQFDGALIVLKDNKLWIDVRQNDRRNEQYHPFTGYYLPWPHGNTANEWKQLGYAHGEGLVTTINDENFLNWAYVDRETHEVRYGVRAEAERHKVGPWSCTKIERRLSFEGWEGFMAVQEEEGEGMWALYFDCNDDGLRRDGQPGRLGKPILELEVWRRELRRERFDAVSERMERLQLREEQEGKSEGVAAAARKASGFDERLEVQRGIEKEGSATDFETKMQRQREMGRSIFTK